MQNLIPGEEYEIVHPKKMWDGKAVFVAQDEGSPNPYRFKDLKIRKGGEKVVNYFEDITDKRDNSFTLGDAAWCFTLIPRIEENE